MPKSGFDPRKQQRKSHRHNPLSGGGDNADRAATVKDQPQVGPAQAVPPSPSNDIIPLLSKLPLPDTPASQAAEIDLSDKVWALASVSLLLTPSAAQSVTEVKSNRKLLLSYNLVRRLIHALQSHSEAEVKREASGALRNLCVDAGFGVRSEVANKGGVDAVLFSMRWAAHTLGFDTPGSSSKSTNTFPLEALLTEKDELEKKRALLSKPLDQMNKKEKRNASKIAVALGKTLEQVAGQGLSADDEAKLSGKSAQDNQDQSISIENGSSNIINSNTTTSRGPTAHGSSSYASSEPFFSLDSETRKALLETAENLATVAWSLCECGGKPFAKLVSTKWADSDLVGLEAADQELPGEALASWLCGAVALGCRAASVLSTSAVDGTRQTSSIDAVSSLANDELSLLLDLALAAANALCGLTDGGETDFVDGLLGHRSTLIKTSSNAKRPTPHYAVAQSIDEPSAQASKRLAEIDRAISLLEACVATNSDGLDRLKRYVLTQTTMLGVLSAGVVRNIIAAVDSNPSGKGKKNAKDVRTSANVFVAARPHATASSALSLQKYEQSVILPTLVQLLGGVNVTALAKDLEGHGDVVVSITDDDDDKTDDSAALRSKMQIKAEEKTQTLMLALEVLAEMAATLDASSSKDIDGEEWQEELEAEQDAEMDQDNTMDDMAAIAAGDNPMDGELGDQPMKSGNDDDDGDDDQDVDDAVQDTFADAVKRSGSIRFEQYAPNLTQLIAPPTETGNRSLADVLLPLARPFEASFPSLGDPSPTSVSDPALQQAPALLRGLHSRSLSVLNNVLLRLAVFSPPPPSQPVTTPKEQRRVAAFRAWIAVSGHPAHQLDAMFKALYEIARGCASVPAVAGSTSTTATGPLLSVSATTAAASDSSSSASPPTLSESADGIQMVETCIGSMWSLSRILEGRVALAWSPTTGSLLLPSSPDAASAELIQSLFAAYSSATTDSMRVKCLGLVSTIARYSDVFPQLNFSIASFLIQTLESIPEPSNHRSIPPSSIKASTTTPEAMVAAVNGLIDIYADETTVYDVEVFRKQGFLKRIRLIVFRCRALTRTIDRRRQLSLRTSAEEAVENLAAFVQYRQQLGF